MKILSSALDLIFPPVCGFCGKVNNKYICEDCNKIVNAIALNKIDNYNNKFFEKHLYIFKYEDIIREKIIKFKFENEAYLHRTFAKAILSNKKNIEFIEKYDYLIPVPIHKKRKKQRGYNQSELVAKAICDEIKNIKLQSYIIIKDKNIVPQSSLNQKERIENIKNVYKILNTEKVKNKKILILDDIYTTGSTANECSRILQEAGSKEIGVLTIAKDINEFEEAFMSSIIFE